MTGNTDKHREPAFWLGELRYYGTLGALAPLVAGAYRAAVDFQLNYD
ncbi:hypothetical protein [Serratia entomophila]|nr:hypothetical protein [Serratia entomophila]